MTEPSSPPSALAPPTRFTHSKKRVRKFQQDERNALHQLRNSPNETHQKMYRTLLAGDSQCTNLQCPPTTNEIFEARAIDGSMREKQIRGKRGAADHHAIQFNRHRYNDAYGIHAAFDAHNAPSTEEDKEDVIPPLQVALPVDHNLFYRYVGQFVEQFRGVGHQRSGASSLRDLVLATTTILQSTHRRRMQTASSSSTSATEPTFPGDYFGRRSHARIRSFDHHRSSDIRGVREQLAHRLTQLTNTMVQHSDKVPTFSIPIPVNSGGNLPGFVRYYNRYSGSVISVASNVSLHDSAEDVDNPQQHPLVTPVQSQRIDTFSVPEGQIVRLALLGGGSSNTFPSGDPKRPAVMTIMPPNNKNASLFGMRFVASGGVGARDKPVPYLPVGYAPVTSSDKASRGAMYKPQCIVFHRAGINPDTGESVDDISDYYSPDDGKTKLYAYHIDHYPDKFPSEVKKGEIPMRYRLCIIGLGRYEQMLGADGTDVFTEHTWYDKISHGSSGFWNEMGNKRVIGFLRVDKNADPFEREMARRWQAHVLPMPQDNGGVTLTVIASGASWKKATKWTANIGELDGSGWGRWAYEHCDNHGCGHHIRGCAWMQMYKTKHHKVDTVPSCGGVTPRIRKAPTECPVMAPRIEHQQGPLPGGPCSSGHNYICFCSEAVKTLVQDNSGGVRPDRDIAALCGWFSPDHGRDEPFLNNVFTMDDGTEVQRTGMAIGLHPHELHHDFDAKDVSTSNIQNLDMHEFHSDAKGQYYYSWAIETPVGGNPEGATTPVTTNAGNIVSPDGCLARLSSSILCPPRFDHSTVNECTVYLSRIGEPCRTFLGNAFDYSTSNPPSTKNRGLIADFCMTSASDHGGSDLSDCVCIGANIPAHEKDPNTKHYPSFPVYGKVFSDAANVVERHMSDRHNASELHDTTGWWAGCTTGNMVFTPPKQAAKNIVICIIDWDKLCQYAHGTNNKVCIRNCAASPTPDAPWPAKPTKRQIQLSQRDRMDQIVLFAGAGIVGLFALAFVTKTGIGTFA